MGIGLRQSECNNPAIDIREGEKAVDVSIDSSFG
jgi:hypothetical protein